MHYHIHKELQDATIWTWPSSKGQTKVNFELVRDFEVKNIFVKLPNDTGNSCRVIVFTWQLDLEIVWKFKKITQRSMLNLSVILYVENIHVTLQHDTGNLRKVIAFTRSSQMLPAWKFIKVTQRSRSKLVEILMCRTSLPVQLQHDAGKFWCIIIFTRSCKMLPFEHDLFQKVKQVRQRSTLNSSEILMWRISL